MSTNAEQKIDDGGTAVTNHLFVFIDDKSDVYAAQMFIGGKWWLHSWSDATKSFTRLREISENEVKLYRGRELPPERAALYLKGPVQP